MFDVLDSDADHILSFIDGFESIIRQYRENGAFSCSGNEGYTIAVFKSNGFNPNPEVGFENFITNGIKKAWEVFINFFKSIWDFFFGKEKVMSEGIKRADTTKELSKELDTKFKNGEFKIDNDSMEKEYKRIERVNTKVKEIKALVLAGTAFEYMNHELITNFDDIVKELSSKMDSGTSSSLKSKFDRALKKGKSVLEKMDSNNKKLHKAIDAPIPEGNRMDYQFISGFTDKLASYGTHSKEAFILIKDFTDSVRDIVDSRDFKELIEAGRREEGISVITTAITTTEKTLLSGFKSIYRNLDHINDKLNELIKILE